MPDWLVGYAFLVDPAQPWDPDGDYELVRMATLRPGDLFGFLLDDDPRLVILGDESRPLEERAAALRAAYRDAPRYRFTRDTTTGDRTTAKAVLVEDWRAPLQWQP